MKYWWYLVSRWFPSHNILSLVFWCIQISCLPLHYDVCLSVEQVAVLKGHSGLVKGVTWDPVGKYLASQVLCINEISYCSFVVWLMVSCEFILMWTGQLLFAVLWKFSIFLHKCGLCASGLNGIIKNCCIFMQSALLCFVWWRFFYIDKQDTLVSIDSASNIW